MFNRRAPSLLLVPAPPVTPAYTADVEEITEAFRLFLDEKPVFRIEAVIEESCRIGVILFYWDFGREEPPEVELPPPPLPLLLLPVLCVRSMISIIAYFI